MEQAAADVRSYLRLDQFLLPLTPLISIVHQEILFGRGLLKTRRSCKLLRMFVFFIGAQFFNICSVTSSRALHYCGTVLYTLANGRS